MKRINITQAAAVFGVAGLLGVASLAIAGEQKPAVKPAQPAITDPASLMKFEHAHVINATPEQLAAAARASTPMNGQRAYVDSNGQLRGATQQELVAEASAAKASKAKVAAPSAKRLAAAAVQSASTAASLGRPVVELDDSYMSYAVAHVGKDGKVKTACVDVQPSEKAALAVAEAAPEVDRHEK